MLKPALVLLLIINSIFHSVGFYRSFSHRGVVSLKKHISKPHGWLWFICSLLFLLNSIFIILNVNGWIYFVMAAILISQVLIFLSWREARYGTIINIVILILGFLYRNNFLT